MSIHTGELFNCTSGDKEPVAHKHAKLFKIDYANVHEVISGHQVEDKQNEKENVTIRTIHFGVA